MGEFGVGNVDSPWQLEKILSCDIRNMKIGGCRYGFMCNHDGGVIDDLIVYRRAEADFMLVTNAANYEKVRFRLRNYTGDFTSYWNETERTAKIDVQGPKAPKIVAGLMKEPIDELKFYNFANNYYKDTKVIVSRTGYTGEIGFEVYCPVEIAGEFWDDCVAGGAIPAGLGARDTLRLEMGFPLYGHELSEERNAGQSGFTRAISKYNDFIGWEPVRDSEEATRQALRGINLEGRRTAHQGDKVLNSSGAEVGIITSGSYSPTLGHAIALAYVDSGCSEIDTEVKIISGKNEFAGKICTLPFYKNATARDDIKLYL
jgi:aminomethyltransferase